MPEGGEKINLYIPLPAESTTFTLYKTPGELRWMHIRSCSLYGIDKK